MSAVEERERERARGRGRKREKQTYNKRKSFDRSNAAKQH